MGKRETGSGLKPLREDRNDWGITVGYAPFGGHHSSISVYKTRGCYTGNDPVAWQPADVNWAAIGSVSPDEADTYADAIKAAAAKARELDEEVE